jgi:ribosomal protein S18 acetylase RimI-like enzyme
VEGLTIRKATSADQPRIAELVSGEPSREATGIAGSERAARRIGLGAFRIEPYGSSWKRAAIAEIDGESVGVMVSGAEGETAGLSLALIWLALRALGPIGLLRARPRFAARSRMQIPAPAGAYHVGELDVDPRYQNRGIGGALLDYAEAEARASGHKQMSLTTTTDNPARHLYERHGFRIVETRTDADYERYTGIAGRVLMVKDLA